MNRSVPRTPVINNSIIGGKRQITTEITTDTHDRFSAVAKAHNTTRGALFREIVTRIAERPDLLVAVLPEPRA